MATFAISLCFTVSSKDSDKAYELTERIGNYVVQEDMATEFSVIDVEELESDEVLDFEDDDEDDE